MLKVLIVDDEPLAREGLRDIIPWEEYGFQVCGEGVDGIDALEKIAALTPNLVLMDIRMPGIYGIDVIEYALERGFKGKFIVLTGYAYFEYIKSSINLGVCSYILKPIEEEEFIEEVKKVGQEIIKDIERQKIIENSEKYLKSITLKSMISGENTLYDMGQEERMKSLTNSCRSFQVALIYSQAFLGDGDIKEETISSISKILNMPDSIEVVAIEKNVAILIKNKDYLKSTQILERLYKKISTIENSEVFITLGRLVEEYNHIPQSYRDAVKLLELGFFQDEVKVVSWDVMNNELGLSNYETKNKEISEYTEELFTLVEVNNKERITALFNNLSLYFVRSDYSIDKIRGIAINIYVVIKGRISAKDNINGKVIPSSEEFIRHIYEKNNLYSLINYLSEVFCSVSDKAVNNSKDSTIKRVLDYIDKNFNKPLKLEGLAEIFNYNSAYLGRIFRSHTGDNFNDYLDRVRIENAKKLLNEKSEKIYKVSEKVGYSNRSYFYEKFKKYVGVGPQEYKKKG